MLVNQKGEEVGALLMDNMKMFWGGHGEYNDNSIVDVILIRLRSRERNDGFNPFVTKKHSPLTIPTQVQFCDSNPLG